MQDVSIRMNPADAGVSQKKLDELLLRVKEKSMKDYYLPPRLPLLKMENSSLSKLLGLRLTIHYTVCFPPRKR